MSEMTSTVRVLLADDHALMRAGLCGLIRAIPGAAVVAEADGAPAAIEAARHLQPDVVVLNTYGRGFCPRATTQQLVAELPSVKVLVIGSSAAQADVLAALTAGVRAYLVKDSSPDELAQAFAAIARGETFLSPSASQHVVADYMRITGNGPATPRALSPRQREVLRMIAVGMTSKEIARTLNLSVKTVETHRTQLMSHLDIHQVAGLVRYAIRTGLVSVDE